MTTTTNRIKEESKATKPASNGKASPCGVFVDAKTGKLTISGNAAHEMAKRIKGLKVKHAATEERAEATRIKREIADVYGIFVQIVQDLDRGKKQDALQILGLELEGVSFLRGKLGYNMQYR